jgi:methenyltetrahydromethanopterin cyclohydrolase
MFPMLQLNRRAAKLVDELVDRAEDLRITVHKIGASRVVDMGVQSAGGLEAGRRLAEVCLCGLGKVSIAPSDGPTWLGCPRVVVSSDQPVAACMASQYAGWQISVGKYFAMGSGPMRAAAGKEELFQHIGHIEKPDVAVGVLEASQLPTPEVCDYIAKACGVVPENLTLCVARTASIAATVQIVARSVETALHKLHELSFDLGRVVSGFGTAPLPPVAADDLTGIGRTNDAILYGGEVTLWVRGDDDSLRAIGPLVPSSASPDHGVPFLEIFERYDRDFYRIDRHLFSPAVITLVNLDTGRSHRFGKPLPDVLRRSLGIEGA